MREERGAVRGNNRNIRILEASGHQGRSIFKQTQFTRLIERFCASRGPDRWLSSVFPPLGPGEAAGVGRRGGVSGVRHSRRGVGPPANNTNKRAGLATESRQTDRRH